MIEMKKTVMAETKSKLAVRFFVSLLTLLFAVGGIFASGKAETEDSTGGQIYLDFSEEGWAKRSKRKK